MSINRHAVLFCLALLFLGCIAPDGHRTAYAQDPTRLTDLTGQWETPRRDLLWNFDNLYNANVLYFPGREYPYLMWLFGWSAEDGNPAYPGADAIFHARSKDMLIWEVYSGNGTWDKTMDPSLWVPVLCAGTAPYDNVHNGDPSVVAKDGHYYMAFSSVGFDTVHKTDGDHTYVISCVMGATSDDGIHWQKTSAPILIWDQEYTNRWEILNGQIPPAPRGYYGSYLRPCLMWDNGRWKIWFDYMLTGTFVSLGYAENQNAFMNPADWTVLRANTYPALHDWPNNCVVRVGSTYYSFADPPGYSAEYGGDGRLITMAKSINGWDWQILGHISPDGLDCSNVPEALVLHTEGRTWLYVYYAWRKNTAAGATPDFSYKKIRYMRLPLSDRTMVDPDNWRLLP